MEPQYQDCIEIRDTVGFARFGLMSNQVWHDDPKRIVFVLSRYKFVAKLLSGAANVLEVGCGDAFASRIVRQEVKKLTVTDFDPLFIEDAAQIQDPKWPIETKVHDMLCGPVDGRFDGAYSLDVLEHIEPADERRFLDNLCASLSPEATVIIGMPSLESQAYASPQSREGHVNCKSMPDFKSLMRDYFSSVSMFSMNDEVVHTGFHPMAHYLIALCSGLKKPGA
ncbi:MAG: class I SAM-dependent methyltransferase [Rhodospirillales bacterium]